MPFTNLNFLVWPHFDISILFAHFKSRYSTALMCSLWIPNGIILLSLGKPKNSLEWNKSRFWNKIVILFFSSALYYQSWCLEKPMSFTKLNFLAWPHFNTSILFAHFKSRYTTALMCSLWRYPWNAWKVSPEKRYSSFYDQLCSKSRQFFWFQVLTTNFLNLQKWPKNEKKCKSIWLAFLKTLENLLESHQINKQPRLLMNAWYILAAHCGTIS